MIWLAMCGLCTVFVESKTLNDITAQEKSAPPQGEEGAFDQLQTLTLEEVLSQLQQSAREQIQGEFELELTHHPLPVDVPVKAPLSYTIHAFKLNPQQNRFTATLEFADPDLPPMPLQGKIMRMVEIPVLAHTVAAKQMIQESDIKWLKVPESQVNRFVVSEVNALVGSEVKGKNLQANVPIRASDVQKPRAVTRNSMITMRYTSDHMQLESRGLALQEGELGASIKVKNTESGKMLVGIITAPGVVEIAPQASHSGDVQ
ncbi:MAG: flagellar basal body P-ring formation chaperone FlgA [Holosporales bacterium]